MKTTRRPPQGVGKLGLGDWLGEWSDDSCGSS